MRVSAIFLLLVVSIAVQGTSAETKGSRLEPWRIERDIQRFKTVATDNVMKLLELRTGMTILDIGAGTGQFAYEFARRLDGTGKVYATDTNGQCIDFIRKEAGRRGLENLHPVLVRKDGIDGFYGKQKYDLITVFHISMTFEDQVDYFRELRGSLAEGGRLILILYKIATPFSSGDFTGDFPGLIRELSLEPAGSPFYNILKDSTRKRIGELREAEPSEELRNTIAGEFNGMLSDTRFAAQFSKGSVFRKDVNFSPEERGYAGWLLPPYKYSGPLRKDINIQNALSARTFATINKLLILQRYRKYLKRDGLFVSGFTSSIKAAFEKAGYRVEQVYSDIIPFEDMIVFSSR
jgi:ubiquinone/menaquinone biosynthesis C-methylase UbiE